MYTELASATLKDGQKATIARVQTPDGDWESEIRPLLSHKDKIWRWQIEHTLTGPTEPLKAFYYIALIDGSPISNVCTYEYSDVGILGHVFTKPDFRRLGCCTAVMSRQMDDFRARGGKALFLGTGLDNPARGIYSRFGFRSLNKENVYMAYYADSESGFNGEYFKPADSFVRPVDWRDWAGSTALTCQKSGSNLRLVALEAYNRVSMEYPFLILKRGASEMKDVRAFALESKSTSAVAGIAYTLPDSRFPSSRLLDLFVHPNFADNSGSLLSAFGEFEGDQKVQAYAESTDTGKINALKAAGFSIEATLKRQMKLDNGVVDVVLLNK